MEGVGSEDHFATRPRPPQYASANTNGILSRPVGGDPLSSGPLVGLGGSTGGATRAQQPSHEVFMVREASRPSMSSSTASPFVTAGSRSESGNSLLSSSGMERSTNQSHATTSDSHHHRATRGGADRFDRDREREKHILPKMLKIAVVGESTAGKTAICNAFTSEGYNFSRNYHMTTSVSVYAKSIKLPTSQTGESGSADGIGGGRNSSSGPTSSSGDDTLLLDPQINLVLVDSAGKPIYRELLPQYWDRLDGMALVIDLTSSSALETASDWVNLAKSCITDTGASKDSPPSDGSGDQRGSMKLDHPGQPRSFLGVLIGSKSDLKEQRVVSPKAAQDFAVEHSLQYFECSAKENSGLEEPFFYLAHQWTYLFPSKGSSDKENFMGGAGGPSPSTRKSTLVNRQSSSEAF